MTGGAHSPVEASCGASAPATSAAPAASAAPATPSAPATPACERDPSTESSPDRPDHRGAERAERAEFAEVAQLQAVLVKELAQMLQIDPSRIDGGTSLRDLGLDSLMTLELRTRLQTRHGIALSVVKLASLPSVSRIAEYAAGKREER